MGRSGLPNKHFAMLVLGVRLVQFVEFAELKESEAGRTGTALDETSEKNVRRSLLLSGREEQLSVYGEVTPCLEHERAVAELRAWVQRVRTLLYERVVNSMKPGTRS